MKRLNLLTTLAVALGIGFASCSEDNLPIGPDVDTVVESDLKITRSALETNDPWIALGFKKTGNTWSALGNYNKKDNKDTARYKITFDEDVLKYRFIAATPQQANIITLKENDSTTFAVNLAHSSDVAISYKDVKFSRPTDKTQIIDSTIALPNMRHQAALLGFNISMQDKRNSSGEQMNPFYGWYIKIDTFQLHNVLKEGVMRFIKDGENKGNQADKVYKQAIEHNAVCAGGYGAIQVQRDSQRNCRPHHAPYQPCRPNRYSARIVHRRFVQSRRCKRADSPEHIQRQSILV